MPTPLHLFQAYGVELEYMIVDRDTLRVKPVTDELLKHVLGKYGGDAEHGMVTWSNELVLHVVEMKSTEPEANLPALTATFQQNVKSINKILGQWNAMLMPAAAHPFMDPMSETRLWPHDNNEVYAVYNSIFDCRGHGWSNLQSTHLNLPFAGDEEFGKLHAAVRLVLPLLPALCASSPVLDSKQTGILDTRMMYYKTNQAKMPSITGKVIPEPVYSEIHYRDTIYRAILADIATHDPIEDILDPVWVNSRGAIARFDRGSIEIRVMDIQECPAADMAIVALVIETLKALVNGMFIDLEKQKKWKTDDLAAILDSTTLKAQEAIIDNENYLNLFGYNDRCAKAGELWEHILHRVSKNNDALKEWQPFLNTILQKGTLAQRIVAAIGPTPSKQTISDVYRQLCNCLEDGLMFEV